MSSDSEDIPFSNEGHGQDDPISDPDIENDIAAPSNVSFAELGLNDWLVDSLRAMSIRAPSEIQSACIPPILAGRDVIGGAKTGSGKTAAFALPILQKLSEDPYGVFALVLTPTRELAFQIAEQFRVLGKSINVKESVVVGGLGTYSGVQKTPPSSPTCTNPIHTAHLPPTDMMKQALDLSRRPHIIIATPGRLRDHIQSSPNAVHLSRLRFLVLDEADRLLSSTFASDLETILSHVPSKRQTLLFTATMTESILALEHADNRPFVHRCNASVSTVATLEQRYVFVPSHVRETYLAYLLRCDEFEGRSTIVFCGRCATAEMVTVMLKELGVRCTALHSQMTQQERLDSLGKFRAEVIKVLVATDVGSRGLDIPTVQLVLNYDVPRDPTDYIHRVGRTARAGRGGQAVTIVSERDVQLVQNIEARTNKQMDEYKINENKILEMLTEVSTAKRVATMVRYVLSITFSFQIRNDHDEYPTRRRLPEPYKEPAVPTGGGGEPILVRHMHDTNFGQRTEVRNQKKRIRNGTEDVEGGKKAKKMMRKGWNKRADEDGKKADGVARKAKVRSS
ncbi:hypothetical protein BC938DRAFT_472191 [Jimgerdemannia flammicorona]|uniref:P-loop containing nucleoside triphosphate hydrolase protein n=1 Tax=Jimgerdemannia flammicorona TaxID=994334 RepID=A0A433Q6M1_9FUNG|nr:hypothetical protein BC938DRAFT_472191 [Jimgerdemannia flammicorona]